MKLRQYAGIVGGLAAAIMLAACGETETSVAPAPVNPFAALRVGADSTLEVMTWNIENFPKYSAASANYVDGAPTTADWVLQIVEGLEPDVIAVEEISNENGGGPAFDSLLLRLDGWDGYRATTDRYQNLGFIYRTNGGLQVNSVVPILASASSTFMRIPLALDGTWNGVPFVVIVLHLKAQDSGTADEQKRRESCLLLDEYISANYADTRVFVVGDMNDVLTDGADDNVFQNFLDQPESWRFLDMAIAQGPSDGWSYPGWPSHLDHILVTNEVFPSLESPGAVTMVVPLAAALGSLSKYDTEISDHLPVVVRLVP